MPFSDNPATAAYCANVLREEVAKADYAGMTQVAGFAWLTAVIPQSPVSTPTGLLLTPYQLAKIIGAAKTEAVAKAIVAAYPTVGQILMNEGVDPTKAESQAFLTELVAGSVLAQADLDAINAAAVSTVTPDSLPPRFHDRFSASVWPHVSSDGATFTNPEDPAIHGFPNAIDPADWAVAWSSAGRS